MYQIFPKTIFSVGGLGVPIQHLGINDGNGSGVFVGSRAPMALPGLLRNLTLYCGEVHPDVSVDILIDGVAAGVPLTLLSGQTQIVDTVNSVSWNAGQTVEYLVTTINSGFDMSLCPEIVSTAQLYCVTAISGTFGVGQLTYGGALGNGYFAGNRSSQSINALDGACTHLALRRFGGVSGGSWVAYLEVDTVLQDGTGGTVNTTCTLLDSDASGIAFSTFNLPITPVQHVNVVVLRAGVDTVFAVEQFGVGIAFVPTAANAFMCCGGSNDAIAIPGTDWKWMHSLQDVVTPTIIENQAAIGGQQPIRINTLYVEHTVPATAGQAFTDTLLKNGVASDITVVVPDPATSGSDSGSAIYDPSDLIVIRLDSTAGTNPVAKFYWGMAGELYVPVPPCPGLVTTPRIDGLPYVPFS